MSDFLRSIKEEDAKSTAEARQEQVRSDVRKRKKKYVLNDQEIMKAIGEFKFENDDADEKIYKFLQRISCHLQNFQKFIPSSIENDPVDENVDI